MKLRSLYCQDPALFGPITFVDGLNVILGTVTQRDSTHLDTHNLGKTLLAQVIDFCLLRGKTADFFLFEHAQFKPFVFYLEIELGSASFVTVRRSVAEGTCASFKRHDAPNQNFSVLPKEGWDHWLVAFERSRELLEGLLDLTALVPWNFRNAVSYALRSQRDYDEPFKLAKHAGGHSTWKPFLAHILGLDGRLVEDAYKVEEALGLARMDEAQLKTLAGDTAAVDKARGRAAIVTKEAAALLEEIDEFNLAIADERTTKELVDDIDSAIGSLNTERYALSTDRHRVKVSLEQRMSLPVSDLEVLFKQAKLYFGDQVRKDYAALESFNRELLDERTAFLRAELAELDSRIESITEQLEKLNRRRASALKTLTDGVSIAAYKRLTKRYAEKQAEVELTKTQITAAERLHEARQVVRKLEGQTRVLQERLEENVQQPSPVYGQIREYFDDVVYAVINRHGNLYSSVNKQSHLEFQTEIVSDEGTATSAGKGYTYGRLLCIAFDMAILRAYADKRYPHFVYHDGALESLDDRKKTLLIGVMRRYVEAGTQHIITAIEDELPQTQSGGRFEFAPSEIVLRLHDRDNSGRLFRMDTW